MNFVSTQLQMTLEKIFKNVGTKISDVRPTVHGRAARVDVDLVRRSDGLALGRARSRIARGEFFELPGVGVKEAKCHVLHLE
jgi:hypothetical protein